MNCFCDGSGKGPCPECGGPEDGGHIEYCFCEAGIALFEKEKDDV